MLVLDRRVTAAAVARVLGERVGAVPRLRQRLLGTPLGCGPPVWSDDPAFELGRHLHTVRWPEPGDDRVLLDTVLPHVLAPLLPDRPLCRAVLVDGPVGGRTALAFVVHHVPSDGLGGLAVLDRLLDGADPARIPPAYPRPPARRLAADAWRSRGAALRATPDRLRRLRTAMAAEGGVVAVRVEPCSLLRVTGPRRRAVVARVRLTAVREAAHHYDGSVNAALLTAVAEALRQVLEWRGETIGAVTAAVPVGTPRRAGGMAGTRSARW